MHCPRKEIVSGEGGRDDKENFFERHYFLRLPKQFSEKWGHMPPPPGSYGTVMITSFDLSQEIFATDIWAIFRLLHVL